MSVLHLSNTQLPGKTLKKRKCAQNTGVDSAPRKRDTCTGVFIKLLLFPQNGIHSCGDDMIKQDKVTLLQLLAIKTADIFNRKAREGKGTRLSLPCLNCLAKQQLLAQCLQTPARLTHYWMLSQTHSHCFSWYATFKVARPGVIKWETNCWCLGW